MRPSAIVPVMWEMLLMTAMLGPVTVAGLGTRDLSVFPPCLTDSDCSPVSEARAADYKCFQYMCFPWAKAGGSWRSCVRDSECGGLAEKEGGDGGQGDCYRHPDRRNVFAGICLDKR